MEIEGWRGEKVRLVPPDRALHFENAYRWINDPVVTANVQHNLGATRRQEEAFFDRIEARDRDELVWAILDPSGRHIGFTGLHQIHFRMRSALGGTMIGDRDAWGRGYATDTLRVRARIAFEQLGLHRVEGHTFNPAMRRVYEKAGYRHEGTARKKLWRHGRWQDVGYFALLDEVYFAGSPPG